MIHKGAKNDTNIRSQRAKSPCIWSFGGFLSRIQYPEPLHF